MPSVAEILAALDRMVPAASAASWDPSGLQIGDLTHTVESVAVCHEVGEEVVAECEAGHPELLITYHPLLFRPVTSLVAGRTPTGRALRLARSGTAVAVAHTSFDSSPGGTGDALAGAIGLDAVAPLGPTGPAPSSKVVTFVPAADVERVAEAMAAAGGGRIGNYTGCSFRSTGIGAFAAEAGADPAVGRSGENRVEEIRVEMITGPSRLGAVLAALVSTHPYEEPAYDVYETVSNGRFIGRIGDWAGSFDELVDRVIARIGGPGLRVSRADHGRAARVAVLPGSGSSFVGEAAAAGADVLVTGDVDHHRAVDAVDRGISVIDPGHARTERPGMAALVRLVSEVAGPVVDLTGHDPTPWR